MKFISLKLVFLLILGTLTAFPQNFSIDKIEPPNWWVGMRWDTVQLMVYGQNLEGLEVKSENLEFKVLNTFSPENTSYLFINIYIQPTLEPSTYTLIFSKDDRDLEIDYPIFQRELLPEEHLGFSNEDVIYLIFADRFCDGNTINNTIGDSLDEFTSADLDGRKGGDIEGIISKLDYLKQLGVTSIWITPMVENNMWMSYHGYAATDLYKIDPRFGSNDLYKLLVNEAHQRGIKIILDHVSNHIGINHHWVKNLPAKDWFNGSPEDFIPASHDKMAFIDIHGDSTIVKFNQRGWFTDYMPDLNQTNPFLKTYLIQNTLWWIEFAGIDGIREDTYPYNDQQYLSEWAEAILNEYPNFNIVGEVWQGVPAVISAYQSNSPIRKNNFDSNLPALTDFALYDAIRDYLSGEETIHKVYETLTQDIVYSDPDNLCVFFDNHDIDRAMYILDGSVDKFKIALNLILFTRGIPVIFYGTEIGIKGGPKHGELREPFPGGFIDHDRNAFTQSGRTEIENEIFDYLQELLKLRNEYPVLAKGTLRHIFPTDDAYLLVKELNNETALVFINASENDLAVQPSQLKMFLPGADFLMNLKTNEDVNLNQDSQITINKLTAEIFLVRK